MSIIHCYNCCNVLDAKNEGIEGCYDPDGIEYICPACLEQICDTHHLDYDRASYDESVARDVFRAAAGKQTRAEYLRDCLEDERCTRAAAVRIRKELRALRGD